MGVRYRIRKSTLPALGHIGPEVRSFSSVDGNTVYSLEPSRRARGTTQPGQLTVCDFHKRTLLAGREEGLCVCGKKLSEWRTWSLCVCSNVYKLLCLTSRLDKTLPDPRPPPRSPRPPPTRQEQSTYPPLPPAGEKGLDSNQWARPYRSGSTPRKPGVVRGWSCGVLRPSEVVHPTVRILLNKLLL